MTKLLTLEEWAEETYRSNQPPRHSSAGQEAAIFTQPLKSMGANIGYNQVRFIFSLKAIGWQKKYLKHHPAQVCH
ncbi:excisionase [Yersinia intermedia]|nr:excisionase [Yersinia intermedia]